jgi:5-methylcytosine-specific restriction endonuclease McrA
VTTERIPSYAGFKKPTGQCRWCKADLPPNRTFCSASERDCIHQHKLRTQPAYAASCVLERDQGVCFSCGRDCVALTLELEKLAHERAREEIDAGFAYHCNRAHARPYGAPAPSNCGHESCIETAIVMMLYSLGLARFLKDRAAELSIPLGYLGRRRKIRRLWEMDHVVPVVKGGGGCGLDNLRTLCWACHRAETARLAAERARARKASV